MLTRGTLTSCDSHSTTWHVLIRAAALAASSGDVIRQGRNFALVREQP
jgi:hypothetical protein